MSHFILYMERFLRLHPRLYAKFIVKDLAMVGRVFAKLPLNFMQQLSQNYAVDQDLVEQWSQVLQPVIEAITRDAQNQITLANAHSVIIGEVVRSVLFYGCSQLLDETGRLHSQIQDDLQLTQLMAASGASPVTERVLWSFCTDIVLGNLIYLFQRKFNHVFSDQKDKERTANFNLNLSLVFNDFLKLDDIAIAIKAYRDQKDYENFLRNLPVHFTKFIMKEVVASAEALSEVIYNDLYTVASMTHFQTSQAIMLNRQNFWHAILPRLAMDGHEKIEQALAEKAKAKINPSPPAPAWLHWLNQRDNQCFFKLLLQHPKLKNKTLLSNTLKQLSLDKTLLIRPTHKVITHLTTSATDMGDFIFEVMPNLKNTKTLFKRHQAVQEKRKEAEVAAEKGTSLIESYAKQFNFNKS